MTIGGLVLNFVGTVLLGFAWYKGQSAGYGGPIVWTSGWMATWYFGWFLLAAGFLLQLLSEYLGRLRERAHSPGDLAHRPGSSRRSGGAQVDGAAA